MAGSSQGIMIGDSVLSLIDGSLPCETSSSNSSEFGGLQSFFPSLASLTTPVKSSKTSLKTYNEKWERDPLLRTWIARHPTDPGKVVCCFCNSLVRAHKNDLLEHTRTVKHQRNYMPNVSPDEYKQFIMDLNELKKEMKNLTNKKICSPHSAQINSKGSRNSNGSSHDLKPTGSPSVPFDWETSAERDDEESHKNRLDRDHDDVDGIMIDSPSDLVSVVLEEEPIIPQRETVTIQPVTSKVKHKRRLQQSSLPRPNGTSSMNPSANRHTGSVPQQHSISSAQNFLKLLNAVQSDSLTLNELLLLKKSIDTRINSMTITPKGNQVKVLPSRNSNMPNISLSSLSKNNGITITSMGVPGSTSNQSSSRKRKQEYTESHPVSPVSALKAEMIDVTPDVSDYGILTDDMDNGDDSYFDEQFTD